MKFLIVLYVALATAVAVAVETPVHFKDLVIEDGAQSRITNGIEAAVGQFPYQVGLSLLRPDGLYWCGGSLIGTEYIVTAAHCMNRVSSVTVYLGSTERSVADRIVTVYSDAIITHPDFDSKELTDDIALIRIPKVSLTPRIGIIKLPKRSESSSTYVGSSAIVSGWGRTAETSAMSDNLRYGRVKIVTKKACIRTYGESVNIPGIICAATSGGNSPCNGDSGGPLVLENANTLIGVQSFVSGTCDSEKPAGFARINAYLDWIATKSGISY